MSVRKRVWATGKSVEKTAWVVDYVDAKGKRRLKSFKLKKDADAFEATAKVEVREGVHVADRDTVTVEAAGKLWIASSETAGLERSTIVAYQQHLDLHLAPFIGNEKLSKITVPAVRTFADQLRAEGRSPAMVKKVVTSLGALLSDAQERGLITRKAVKEMSRRRQRREASQAAFAGGCRYSNARRNKGLPCRSGWSMAPSPAIRRLQRPSVVGVAWLAMARCRFPEGNDRCPSTLGSVGNDGATKSQTSQRTVPVPSVVINTLREWKLQCPPGDLVFPNGRGNPEPHANIVNRGLKPSMIRAGLPIDTGEMDENGKPILAARYSGLHALRRFVQSGPLLLVHGPD